MRGGYHWLLQQLAQSVSIASVAAKIRNQFDHIIRYHFGNTFYGSESAAELVLRAVAADSHRIVDVGANVGRWTDAAFEILSPPVDAILIEPSTSALNILSKRFGNDPRVRLVPAAAGDRVSTVTFHEEADAGETSTVVSAARLRPTTPREVQLTTVTKEIAAVGWDRVDIVKIDAEGYDLHVLRGMSELIRSRQVSVVIFEYNVSWRSAGSLLAEAESMLRESGYELYISRKDGLYKCRYARYGEYFSYSNFVAAAPHIAASFSPLLRGSY